MKEFLKIFLSLYGQDCEKIVFYFADGTNTEVTGKPIVDDIMARTKDAFAIKLKGCTFRESNYSKYHKK